MKLFSSRRKIEILDALFNGDSIDSIKKQMPASTYSVTMHSLASAGYVEEIRGDAVLTDRGRACRILFAQLNESLDTLLRLHDAFPEHSIRFPDPFYARLHELQGFRVITAEPKNVLKPQKVFFDYLGRSKHVMGITPFLFPDYIDFFSRMAEQSTRIALVVTPGVYEGISSSEAIGRENVAIYVADDVPPIAAAVTDQFVSIGFFYRSGSYDFTRDLIATSPEAKRFGHDLIGHYMGRSRKVTPP
ncbi:helix-turn-helix transcriptional regulator [Methanoculleus frigidifontis]|nr:transcriptional regulator FilR1 domain-containing protein [Methanoculleus sp. FWC-SCC1]